VVPNTCYEYAVNFKSEFELPITSGYLALVISAELEAVHLASPGRLVFQVEVEAMLLESYQFLARA